MLYIKSQPNFLSASKNSNSIKNGDVVVLMKNITKVFPGVVALNNVNFEIRRGEIHGLLGENGAGKTTLMKVLCGVYLADQGEIYVNHKLVSINSPKDAFKYGIVMVNQYPKLVDQLTVAENIALSIEDIKPHYKVTTIYDRIKEIADEYGFNIDPRTPAWKLSFSERQRVEIMKALLLNAQVIIFDEPTTLLTSREKKLLYQFMRRASRSGKSIVLITHKLSEALEVTDRITVLRNGEVKAIVDTYETSYDDLVKVMFEGRKISLHKHVESKPNQDQVVLSVNNLSVVNDLGETAVKNVSFDVRKGEIFGIAGVAGNGQVELAEAIAGIRRPVKGEIKINGQDISKLKPEIRRRLIGYVPDKVTQAVILDMPIVENFLLKFLDRSPYIKWGLINYDEGHKLSINLIKRFNIFAKSSDVKAGHLSGGNLQKLVLARELSLNPQLLIIVNPTRALDHYSSEFIYSVMEDYKSNGGSILLISEDLEELYKLSDQIGVMFEGILTVLGDKKNIDIETIEEYMVGKKVSAESS